ncbi:MAG: alcohol dehydrogenase catalytic domain-containing protein [Kiritimatiellaeota bacterium]|nr:alcohol dehydrogenase catalytic domain-containing protein [Kiritimatiellota bacterium]
MKALVLAAIQKLAWRDVPEPTRPGPRDVLLEVAAVGVCGSDLHYFNHGRIGRMVVQYPFILGHECSARVLAVGSEVARVQPGDRVAVEPAVSCGVCDQCRAQRRHTCRQLKFLGCPGQLSGCLCERLVLPEECCFPIAPTTTLDQAVLVEVLAIAVYAVRRSEVRPGAAVGILGAGPIGLAVLLVLRQAGIRTICVTEPLTARRALAEKWGASWAGDPYAADAAQALARREPLGLDVVFECCGRQEAVDDALRLLKPGGTLVMVGIPTVDCISLTMDLARRKEIRFQNIRRQNECVSAALELMERDGLPVTQLHTHTFSFDRAAEAFDLVANYRDGVVKALIHVGSRVPPA